MLCTYTYYSINMYNNTSSYYIHYTTGYNSDVQLHLTTFAHSSVVDSDVPYPLPARLTSEWQRWAMVKHHYYRHRWRRQHCVRCCHRPHCIRRRRTVSSSSGLGSVLSLALLRLWLLLGWCALMHNKKCCHLPRAAKWLECFEFRLLSVSIQFIQSGSVY